MSMRARWGVALAAMVGCGGSESRALIPVDVAAGTVTGMKTVEVAVTEGSRDVRRQRFDWAAGTTTLQVGVYLPDGFSGEVAVLALAFDGQGTMIGSSNRVMVDVAKGQRAGLVQLTLSPEAGMNPDGGVPDGGDGGDGGRADAGADGGGSDVPPAADGGDTAIAPDAPAADLAPDATVPTRVWSQGENIEQDLLSSSYTPDVAIDNQGNVIVAWREGDGVKLRRQYGSTRSWGAITPIEDRGTTDEVQVAMAENGHALVIWYMNSSQVDPALQGLWARHSRDRGLTWSGPIHVHAGPVYYEAVVAMAASGVARVAWQESSANVNSLWSARFDPVTGTFPDLGQVKLGSDSDERYPRLAIDRDGAGLLVWVQDDEQDNDSIWASAFSDTGSLSPQLIDDYTTDAAGEVAVAIAADGSRGMAVWQQRNGSTSADLFHNSWVRGTTGWQGPQKVLNADWVSSPAVVIDRAGNATVAYTQPITGYNWNVIQVRKGAMSSTWEPAQPLETANRAGGTTLEDPIPRLGIDGAGDIHAIWRRKVSDAAMSETASVIVRRYSAATMTWQPEVNLGEITDLKAYHPEIAVADEGRAAAAFYFLDTLGTGNDASFNVHVSFFR
jgi:hypothetical protein